jgi:hypothetical protein
MSMQLLVIQFKILYIFCAVESQNLKYLKFKNCPIYSKMAEVILLLYFSLSPVCQA